MYKTGLFEYLLQLNGKILTCIGAIMAFPCSCNSHPSRGRKRNIPHFEPNLQRLQLTPLTGTETRVKSHSIPFWMAATHTPHGDGNRAFPSISMGFPRCNSHPSQGRKRCSFCPYTAITMLQLTPLTGTEQKKTKLYA